MALTLIPLRTSPRIDLVPSLNGLVNDANAGLQSLYTTIAPQPPARFTGSTTLQAQGQYAKFNITAASTATLPQAPPDGTLVTIKNAVASTATLTVAAGSGDTIDAAGASLAAGTFAELIYDATNHIWDVT